MLAGRPREEDIVIRRALGFGIAAALAVTLSPGVHTQVGSQPSNSDKLDITAFAVNMSNINTGANAVIEISVDSWSSEEERQHLFSTLMEKDAAALLRELQKAKVHGRFRIPGLVGPDPHQLRLGLDIRYAWQTALPEGARQIVLATDRPIGFREARSQPRTIDYPFTLMEIRVGKDGRGEGKMAVATRITFNKKTNTLELENYSSEPVRLNNVRVKDRTQG
jgi:hypothetical protein